MKTENKKQTTQNKIEGKYEIIEILNPFLISIGPKPAKNRTPPTNKGKNKKNTNRKYIFKSYQ